MTNNQKVFDRPAAITAALVSVAGFALADLEIALGLTCGAILMAANLMLLRYFFFRVADPSFWDGDRRKVLTVTGLLLVKLVGFIGGVALALWYLPVSELALAAGAFTVVFASAAASSLKGNAAPEA